MSNPLTLEELRRVIPYFSFRLFDEITADMKNLKNAYPFANNNECYNSAIDMCISLISKIKKEKEDNIFKDPID